MPGIGQTVSHYSIVEKIGEGGMGVVYLGRDTHLDRNIAIKVLPPEAVSDPERKRRFVQEAKSASALNHPNIIHIYDIDRSDGTDFIAMEYVPGNTLARLVKHKPLKMGTALKYAVQIADALAAAHAAGIVHRDLKPANIMVTEKGSVKILDFGLAKLMERPRTGHPATAQTIIPGTEEGVIVGTMPYMSPEQAQGKTVDARSDIFSFGSVLYEMLTGRRAFSGETKAMTLASILEKEPRPIGEILKNVPDEIERVLIRCLRKDPERRWQSMADLKIGLQELKEESDSGKLYAVTSSAPGRASPLRIILPAIMVIIGIVLGLLWWQSREPTAQVAPGIERLTFDTGLTYQPTISQDGKLVTYASDRSGRGDLDIYVQYISQPQPLRLTRNEADDKLPSFSPDGSRIVFRSERDGGGIYIVNALGVGEERRIADHGWLPRFSPDGTMVLYIDVADPHHFVPSRMYLISPDGGSPRPFQPEFLAFPSPAAGPVAIWSPDGKFIFFPGYRAADPKTIDFWVAPVDGGPPVQTGFISRISQMSLNPWPYDWYKNRIIYSYGSFVQGYNLYSLDINEKTWQLSDTPRPLTSGTGMQLWPSVARDGSMVFASQKAQISIFSLPLDPVQGNAAGELQKITRDDMYKQQPAISRDGSTLVYGGFRNLKAMGIHRRNMADGSDTAVAATSPIFAFFPRISADGSEIAYRDLVDGKFCSFIVSGGASGSRRICDDCGICCFFQNPEDVLVQYGNKLVRQNLTDGSRTPVLKINTGTIQDAFLSSDDRWIVFQLARSSGGYAIYVAPVGNKPVSENESILVADEPIYLQSPRWSKDDSIIYFISERDGFSCIWAQRLDSSTKTPSGSPFPVYHVHQSRLLHNRPRNSGALSITGDQLIFSLLEYSGNIYMKYIDDK